MSQQEAAGLSGMHAIDSTLPKMSGITCYWKLREAGDMECCFIAF